MRSLCLATALASAGAPAAAQNAPHRDLAMERLADRQRAEDVENFGKVGARYEWMLGCYAGFMEAKGFDMETPKRSLARWDRAARAECADEIGEYRSLVGRSRAERDWKAAWDDYWSRL